MFVIHSSADGHWVCFHLFGLLRVMLLCAFACGVLCVDACLLWTQEEEMGDLAVTF